MRNSSVTVAARRALSGIFGTVTRTVALGSIRGGIRIARARVIPHRSSYYQADVLPVLPELVNVCHSGLLAIVSCFQSTLDTRTNPRPAGDPPGVQPGD